VTEPLTRDDMREKAFHVVKWLTKSRAKAAPDALLVIGYLADVNRVLERRLAILIRLAGEPVVIHGPEIPDDVKVDPEPTETPKGPQIAAQGLPEGS
jgi:hypothetical protein